MSSRGQFATRVLGLCVLSASACLAAAPTIDGSSDEAFQASHVQLLKSLSPEDRLRLTLAEVIVLAPKPCAAQLEPIPESPELTKVLSGQLSLKACRRELNGMTFAAIMALAYPNQAKPEHKP